MRGRLIIICGFAFMSAGLIVIGYCTLLVHRLHAHVATLINTP
jgi:hypothetical protein